MKKTILNIALTAIIATVSYAEIAPTKVDSSFKQLAEIPFEGNYPTKETAKNLENQIYFQRAVQVYQWALPAMNMYAMKESTGRDFGTGYEVMSIYKDRLNAKTIITTPNSDVIYGIGFLDLEKEGPMVIDAPPKLQALIDDMWHRPIEGPTIDGHKYFADIGFPGPDKGKGGKYLVLPPHYKGKIPSEGYYVYKSKTYGVFVFLRSFFKDPKNLAPAAETMMKIKIYPYGHEADAKAMKFPNASVVPSNRIAAKDFSYFEMLNRFIQKEVTDESDHYMRGIAASIGIEKGKKFDPTPEQKELLNYAALTAWKMSKVIAFDTWDNLYKAKWYPDRHWTDHVRDGSPHFGTAYDDFDFMVTGTKMTDVDARLHMFINAYSMSPGMLSNTPNVGAKYLEGAKDSDGNFLKGENTYSLTLPANIPAKIFWSITAYDAETAAGLDNGQPFPSLGSRDKLPKNADGSTTVYFSPNPPSDEKMKRNWIKTIPGKGWFTLLRLYGPEKAFFEQTWKPGDFKKITTTTKTEKKQEVDTGVGKNGEVNSANPAFVNQEGEKVTMDNVVRAETAKYLSAETMISGPNHFRHEREGIQLDHQTIIRSNFDLIYSYGVYDISKGLEITVPKYDLYQIVQVYDENAVTIAVVYPGQTVKLSKDDATYGKHVYLFMRTEPRSLDKKGMDELHERQDSVVVKAGSATPYVSETKYDVKSFNTLRNKLLKEAITKGKIAEGFVSSLDEIKPPQYQMINIAGWGGLPAKYAYYFIVVPGDEAAKEGKSSSVTFKAPDLQYDKAGYWSLTVYDPDGWVKSKPYHVNSHDVKKNADGTITINFNNENAKNNMNTTSNWNALFRCYSPVSVENIEAYKKDFINNHKVLSK